LGLFGLLGVFGVDGLFGFFGVDGLFGVEGLFGVDGLFGFDGIFGVVGVPGLDLDDEPAVDGVSILAFFNDEDDESEDEDDDEDLFSGVARALATSVERVRFFFGIVNEEGEAAAIDDIVSKGLVTILLVKTSFREREVELSTELRFVDDFEAVPRLVNAFFSK
jgi:hypothetical protein